MKRPYGLDHPTWDRPSCFYYETAQEAADSAVRTYGPESGHTVVGPIEMSR